MQTYQLKIILAGSLPQIWRTVLVPSDLTLTQLHAVIQAVMGWHNAHLWSFEKAQESFQMNQANIPLQQVLHKVGDTVQYIYDFGDFWQHKVTLEAINENVTTVSLLEGANACPPEDCGGIWGYADWLEIYEDVDHAEYEDALIALGEDFDPTFFDVTAANQRLNQILKS